MNFFNFFRENFIDLNNSDELTLQDITEGYTNSITLSTANSSLYTKSLRGDKGEDQLSQSFEYEMKTFFDTKADNLRKKRLRGGSIESLLQFLPSIENKPVLDENDYNFIKSFNLSFRRKHSEELDYDLDNLKFLSKGRERKNSESSFSCSDKDLFEQIWSIN